MKRRLTNKRLQQTGAGGRCRGRRRAPCLLEAGAAAQLRAAPVAESRRCIPSPKSFPYLPLFSLCLTQRHFF